MTESFDVNALIRATITGIGVALVAGSAGYFLLKQREQWDRWKSAVLTGLAGLILLIGLGAYYSWPSLIVVPSLDGLSQAEAETLLVKQGLLPDGRPQYAFGIDPGRVIPHSQSPGYGLAVRRGTVVTFAVCVRGEKSPGPVTSAGELGVAMFSPRSGERIRVIRGADRVYRFDARGTSAGASAGGAGLLLWVRPVNPPSDRSGWYLQRPPMSGIHSVTPDGSWAGGGQIGNADYPPGEGNTVDIAVTLADRATVEQLIGEPGVVVRSEPVGVKSAVASGVVVTLR